MHALSKLMEVHAWVTLGNIGQGSLRLTDRHQDLKSCVFLAKNSMFWFVEHSIQIRIVNSYPFFQRPRFQLDTPLQFPQPSWESQDCNSSQQHWKVNKISTSSLKVKVTLTSSGDFILTALWNPFSWEARAEYHKSLKPVLYLPVFPGIRRVNRNDRNND